MADAQITSSYSPFSGKKQGRYSIVTVLLCLIDDTFDPLHKVELARLADLKQLLLETMALTLNISMPGGKKAELRVA